MRSVRVPARIFRTGTCQNIIFFPLVFSLKACYTENGMDNDNKSLSGNSPDGTEEEGKAAEPAEAETLATPENNPDRPDITYKNARDVARGGLLGLFIGLAIIVPGVSGSTVAIIFKLYDKLIYALGNLFRRFAACVKFLLPVVIGAAAGFLLGFFAIQQLMALVPFTVVGLFAGMMIGAYPAVKDEIKGEKITVPRALLFVLGIAIPVAIALGTTFGTEGARPLEGLQFYHYIIFILIGYVVAITQVVPGLSATAILMAFGYFSSIMNSVHLSYWKENPMVLLVYFCMVLGFVIGLLTFSKVLDLIFKKARATAFFMIVGLSLGSLLTLFFNSDIYAVYRDWAAGGVDALDLSLGIVLFIVGTVVAYLFVRYERKKKSGIGGKS